MTKKRKKQRLYKVLVMGTTFVEGKLRKKGETVKVSKDYYKRVVAENDNQLKALN